MQLIKLFFFILLSIPLLAKIEFSLEEKAWILNNPIVKVGVDENWPPFDFVNDKKIHQGISSEYLNYISSQTGLNFEYYSNEWNFVLSEIKNKNLDILACASETNNRNEYLTFSSPYINVDIAVVTRNDFEIDDFDDIQNYRIALPKDNFVHERLKKRFANAEFIFTKSNEEALEYVSYNKADIYVGNLPVVSYFIEKNFLTNLLVAFKAPFEKTTLSIATLKENDILLSILNKALSSISYEEKKIIQNKWVKNNSYSNQKKKPNISLSISEKKWLEKNKLIKIAGDSSWPPYSYVEDGVYKGIVPDLVKEVFLNSKIKLDYVSTKTWDETLSLAKNNKIDLVDAISYSNERKNYLNFSSKYMGAEIVIIANKIQDKYVNDLKNILDKNIATVKGYSIIEKISNDYPKSKELKLFDTPLDGLKSLSNSQVDYFILDIPSFEFYSKKYGLSNLKIVGPTGYDFRYGFGVLKDKPELLSIVNKLLENVSDEKKDAIYRKWIKLSYDKEIDYDLIWKIIIIAFFVLAGTVFWNRKLQAEIRQREKIQIDLQKSKDFIISIMDSQVDIVITTTGEELKQANKAFFEFFSYEDLNSFKKDYKCICDLFDEDKPEKYIQAKESNGLSWIDTVLNNPERIYKALIYKNDAAHIFKITASYISKESNLKTAVFTDITKLEDLNNILVKAKNEALNSAKQKSEFLANMSHEIRTPMNSVIGFTELLDKEITNPIQKDYLSSIKKGGHALLRIINDILDLSKIEAGKLEIKNESINPSNLFLEIESIFHSKIISKNINFLLEIDKNIPKYVILDGVRIRQILFNLIGNSIKFTEKGYIKLKVENLFKDEIKSKIDLIFIVEDTGMGIDKEDLENIFNSFEQQKQQDTMKYGGTGLGLSICRNLVHMMNGEIKASSIRGKGSSFKVILHDVPVSSINENHFLEKKTDYSNIVFEEATILVVDDIEENRKLVDASLKNYNFNIVMAENGEDAIKKLETVNIDLILMDLRMPIMDGYEATIIIKNDKRFKNIPLIALTASVMGKDLEKVSDYGFDGYLRKPVILDDLLEKMSEYLAFAFIKNKNNDQDLDIECIDINKLNALLINLNNDLKDQWLEIKDKGDFTLIEEFADKLSNLGADCSNKLLINYSLELINYIDSFDIEKVDFLMNSYLELIEKIRIQKEEFERE